MASKKMEEALNKQLNAELYSAYLYFAMAAHFDNANLTGFAHWMKLQAKEESTHALKFYEYINEVGGKVVLDAIAKPPVDFGSPLQVFEEVLKHEKHVTALIYDLVKLARNESDYATENFLQWFVSEQVEEEAHATKIVEDLKMIADSKQALFMMDKHLGARQ
ncbi:MAG TPA: ferritin [Candidatus Hydrogenedentes bacterium]|nr:ferritin [Candidatus Hydrogenedentota bacterium]HOL78381.1 ferritin [Candidatus Hydrogenedentota bacterium]HPO87199.1 ferritin [Candidatus Hydrogenedentota bacterium]